MCDAAPHPPYRMPQSAHSVVHPPAQHDMTAESGLLWFATAIFTAFHRFSYIPQQRWLEAWFGATAASLPRCEPQQLTTLSLVLGEWGLVPAPGFSIDFWRASRAR